MINAFMIACLVPFLEVFAASRFPPYIQTCKRDADMFSCFEKNVNVCKLHAAEGIPEFYIPPMDPLLIPKIKLEIGGFVMYVTDCYFQGLQNFELLEMDIDLGDNFQFHFTIKIPFLVAGGMYTAKGKLLMLELDGGGNSTGNVTDVVATVDITGTKVMRNGLEYVNIKDGKISLDFQGPVYIYFDRLFGDREDLTVATNRIIQDNMMSFVKELQPFLGDVIMSIMMSITKQIFKKYPLDELFPK